MVLNPTKACAYGKISEASSINPACGEKCPGLLVGQCRSSKTVVRRLRTHQVQFPLVGATAMLRGHLRYVHYDLWSEIVKGSCECGRVFTYIDHKPCHGLLPVLDNKARYVSSRYCAYVQVLSVKDVVQRISGLCA